MRYQKIVILLLCTAALGVFNGCSKEEETSDTKETAAGQDRKQLEISEKFGEFSSTDLNGNEVTQSVFEEAEVTMLNVWATYCSPCLREMPDLAELNKEYEQGEFQILGIASDVSFVNQESMETAMTIVEETGADYPHLVISEDLLSGPLSGVQVVPTTFFLDQEGNIIGEAYSGAKSKEQWKEIIDASLEAVRENE